MKSWKLWFSAILAIAGTRDACAQTVIAEQWNGTTWVSYDSWAASSSHALNVGTLGTTDLFFRLTDSTTGRTADVQPVTISGSVSSGATVRLHVLVGEMPTGSTDPSAAQPPDGDHRRNIARRLH